MTTSPGGIIAVVRTTSEAAATTVVEALKRTSVAGIELTLTTPGALRILAALAGHIEPGRLLAGTVMTIEQADLCIEAGVGTIVSPHLDAALVTHCLERGVAVIPGAMTPTEVVTAHRLGATAIKVFPVGALGGPAYLRALREPLPEPRYVVSGGVGPAEAAAYVAAGAHALCMGGALIDRDAVAAGDVEAATRFAVDVLARAAA